jgi:hypothetical protein
MPSLLRAFTESRIARGDCGSMPTVARLKTAGAACYSSPTAMFTHAFMPPL